MIFLFISLFIFVAGCSDSNQSKGFGSETTNGIAVSGEVLSSVDERLPLARVRIQSVSIPKDTVISTTDENGLWNAILPYQGSWIASYEYDSIQTIHYFKTSEDSSSNYAKAKLRPKVPLTGIVLTSAGKPIVNAVIRVVGTSIYSTTNQNGLFEFSDLARGGYWTQIETENKSFDAMIMTGEDNTLMESDSSALVVENFDDGDHEPYISSILANSRWVIWWDSASGVKINPPVKSGAEIAAALQEEDAIHGKALRLESEIAEGESTEWSAVLVLGSLKMNGEVTELEGHLMDQADSIVFWAKGEGQLAFRVFIKNASQLEGEMLKLQQVLTLENDWKRYALAVHELAWKHTGLPVGDAWKTLHVFKFEFSKATGGLFLLDEFSIQGITIADLML